MSSRNRRITFVASIVVISIVIILMKSGIFTKVTNKAIPTQSIVNLATQTGGRVENADVSLFLRNEKIVEKNVTVILDAGHGGSDSGTDVGGVLEKDINLDIILRLGGLLKTMGVSIIYTRVTDETFSLKNRIKMINGVHANFLISIHNNSFEKDPFINGTTTLYYTKGEAEEEPLNSKNIAQIVQTELTERLKTKNIGTLKRDNLGILKQVKIPSVITEIGFLTNPTDRENLMEKEFRQNAADALAIAVSKVILQN